MARKHIINPNGSLNLDTIAGFVERMDSHDIGLVDIVTVNSHTVTYAYNADGSVQSTTEKDANNNVVKTVTYTYDVNGNVVSSATVMNGKTVTTTYNYDANGNLTSTTNTVA